MNTDEFELKIKTTNELTNQELLMIMQERVKVFVVEQDCPYQEIDLQDNDATHVFLIDGAKLVAYTRIIEHSDGEHISFGRVLVVKAYRRLHLGRKIVAATLAELRVNHAGRAIKIAGQSYLQAFYHSFGFKNVSDVYLEDGIPHVDMVLDN